MKSFSPLVIGKILSTHGIKGWVSIDCYAYPPENLKSYKTFLDDNQNEEIKILDIKIMPKKIIIKIQGFDDINISENTSNLIDDYMHLKFDFIITVCDHANEVCPYIPTNSSVRIHKNFEDPSRLKIKDQKEKIGKYIKCRDQIKDFCIDFINQNF